MTDLAAIFERHAANNHWGSPESVSGEGSTLGYTYNLRHELARLVREFRVASLFDAPCGDFNWMREVRFPPGFVYTGGDIVAALAQANAARHGGPGRRFLTFDITRDPFPDADVWLCRDCLFHLPSQLALTALRNFARSRIGYVLTTTHLNVTGFENREVEPGGFRLIDLYQPPYRLPREVLFRIADYVHPFPPRELCLWSRAQVKAAVGG